MSVQIIITDPHLMEPGHLAALARMLASLEDNATRNGMRLQEVSAPITAAVEAMPAETLSPVSYVPSPFGQSPTEEPAPSPMAAFSGLSQPAAPDEPGGPLLPPPPSAPVPDRDCRGLPWDGRIHASTRTVNADGTWRNKRGVESSLLASVEAELRATVAAPAPEPVATTAPPPPPATAAPAALTFPQLVRAASERVAAGTLTQAEIVAACQSAGLPSLPMLAARPDLVPTVAAALGIGGQP